MRVPPAVLAEATGGAMPRRAFGPRLQAAEQGTLPGEHQGAKEGRGRKGLRRGPGDGRETTEH